MVTEDERRSGLAEFRYVIRPNCALSCAQAVAVFCACVVSTLAAGLVFLTLGAPLVLPFYGLEMAVLGAALYASMLSGSRQEVVVIGPDVVTVEQGRRRPVRRHEFHRLWAQVVLQGPSRGRGRLALRSHGREVEIGAFLTEDERIALGRELALRVPLRGGSAPVGVQPQVGGCETVNND